MERDYSNGDSDSAVFFTGIEVEKTPAFGLKTLFVVGIQNHDVIMKHYIENDCKHIFFGANHSYHPVEPEEFNEWDDMIKFFLKEKILCSIDVPSNINLEWFLEGQLIESNYCIPQIRFVIPYIQQWNYNTMVKIDDKGYNQSNPGVWCHSLHDLMNRTKFTDWNEYGLDTIIE